MKSKNKFAKKLKLPKKRCINMQKLFEVARVFIYRKNPEKGCLEILFQKRSPFVDGNPNKWDFSAGGHVESGENAIQGILRETKEEIGLSLEKNELEFILAHRTPVRPDTIYHTFLVNRSNYDDEYKLNKREVSEIKWVPFSEFDQFFDKYCKNSIKNDYVTRELLKKWFEEKNGNL